MGDSVCGLRDECHRRLCAFVIGGERVDYMERHPKRWQPGTHHDLFVHQVFRSCGDPHQCFADVGAGLCSVLVGCDVDLLLAEGLYQDLSGG